MRITVLREQSKSNGHRTLAIQPSTGRVPVAGEPVRARLVRCECRHCGAHSNAIAVHDVQASCPNCGHSRLVPVEGADVIVSAERTP
jgi:DNA-directed RNA polymerase subunit RPC12/RpoP